MKTEINNKNKAKFFALYWGQEIVKNLYGLENQDPNGVGGYSINNSQELIMSYLELKPLSQISDEDAIEVAKIFDPNKEEGEWDQILKYKSMFDDLIDPKNIAERLPFTSISNVFDYLRSRGYAIPWMGLSVEEMIEAGWIKLA